MAERRFSLNWKLMAVLLCATLAAVGIWLGGSFLGRVLIEKGYLQESARQKRVLALCASFQDYVVQHQVASTSLEAIGQWNRENPYARLTIQGRDMMITSNRNGADMVGTANGFVVRVGEDADYAYQSAVLFTDGAYQTTIYETSQRHLYALTKMIALSVAAAVFLIIILGYNSRVIRNIRKLQRQVGQVSRGDLIKKIHHTTRDELGQLAADVDAMRLSMIDKLHREQQAWQANTQLLTAISHDVRTPLTALMGYLELLEEPEELTAAQQQTYLRICQSKAEQLRDLTEELFGYFLVFGQPEPEVHLETMDAGTLLEQLLGEHNAELRQRGFLVEAGGTEDTCPIQVDVQHLCRVFGNLYSNIQKYADPGKAVTVDVQITKAGAHIRLANWRNADAGRVESTKIGLQTCKKLTAAMGGVFQAALSGNLFVVELTLLAAPGETSA